MKEIYSVKRSTCPYSTEIFTVTAKTEVYPKCYEWLNITKLRVQLIGERDTCLLCDPLSHKFPKAFCRSAYTTIRGMMKREQISAELRGPITIGGKEKACFGFDGNDFSFLKSTTTFDSWKFFDFDPRISYIERISQNYYSKGAKSQNLSTILRTNINYKTIDETSQHFKTVMDLYKEFFSKAPESFFFGDKKNDKREGVGKQCLEKKKGNGDSLFFFV